MAEPLWKGGRRYAPPLPDGERYGEAGGPLLAPKRKIPAGSMCHYCPAEATTRDHVVPEARGGLTTWWNLVPACMPCNSTKGDASSWCSCPFCQRAKRLWSRGFRK